MPTPLLLTAWSPAALFGRVLGYLVLAGSALGQDASLEQRLRALLAQLFDSKAAVQKQAEDEIIKLGANALAILRSERDSATEPKKTKIGSLIQKIEHEQRQSIARGKTLVVSVGATGKPIADVLAELEKTTTVTIERGSVPGGATTTMAPAALSLWDAVDQICRTHGKLAWDVTERGISIHSEPYVRPNFATASGYGIVFRGFERKSDHGEDYVHGNAVVIGPPGAVMAVHYVTYSELTDDKGTNLLKPAGNSGWRMVSQSTFGNPKRLPEPDFSRAFYEAPQDLLKAVPGQGATTIQTCKGTAFLRTIAELKKTVEIAGKDLKQGAKAKAGGAAIEIESVDLSGASVRMQVAITDPRRGAKDRASFYPETAGRVVLRDSNGDEVQGVRLNPTTGSASFGSGGGSSETMRCEISGQLPGKTSLASIELWEPGEVEEVKIPFAFKDLPITASK
jgi:predicted secreted protein